MGIRPLPHRMQISDEIGSSLSGGRPNVPGCRPPPLDDDPGWAAGRRPPSRSTLRAATRKTSVIVPSTWPASVIVSAMVLRVKAACGSVGLRVNVQFVVQADNLPISEINGGSGD